MAQQATNTSVIAICPVKRLIHGIGRLWRQQRQSSLRKMMDRWLVGESTAGSPGSSRRSGAVSSPSIERSAIMAVTRYLLSRPTLMGKKPVPHLTTTVWTLGLVSLLMDISSEPTHRAARLWPCCAVQAPVGADQRRRAGSHRPADRSHRQWHERLRFGEKRSETVAGYLGTHY